MVYRVEYIFGGVKFVEDVREIKSLIDSILSTERGEILNIRYSDSIIENVVCLSTSKSFERYFITYVTENKNRGGVCTSNITSSINVILDKGQKITSVKVVKESITTEHDPINTDKIDSNL